MARWLRNRRRRITWLAVVVAATMLTGATAVEASAADWPTAGEQPPSQDSFYTPPSPLPSGQPGDVLRSRPTTFSTDPMHDTPDTDVSAWQVLYLSRSASNSPIAVSGTVIVPKQPWSGDGQRPLLSYAVGTRGLGDQCAPSYTLARGVDYEELLINDALAKGWAVAVTDMEGLGTPGIHTYEVGRSQGHTVLDIARAAERLPATGLNATTPVGVMGYSQGGTSAGWAAQLASGYAPELKLKGVAASGVPADLIAVGQANDGNLTEALLWLAAIGYNAAYPELGLTSYLNANGRALLGELSDVCLTNLDGFGQLGQLAFRHMTDFAIVNPFTTTVWQQRVNANMLGGMTPTVPVFQGQALLDEVIPFQQADTLHRSWCARGADVTWQVYTIAEHLTGELLSEPDALAFLADRFAGTVTSGNC